MPSRTGRAASQQCIFHAVAPVFVLEARRDEHMGGRSLRRFRSTMRCSSQLVTAVSSQRRKRASRQRRRRHRERSL